MTKCDMLDLLDDLPEDLDIDELIYMLYVRHKIEVGIAAADAGDEISHEEFEKLSDEWLD